jgi:hypothetical protein
MNIKLVTSCFAALALFAVVSPSTAAPTVSAPGTVAPGPAPQPKIKIQTAVTAKNVAAVPGEKKNYEATLVQKGSNAPLAGKPVRFTVNNIVIGSANTDANGKAVFASYATPELAQGNYPIKASFAGDDNYFATNDDANLLVVKGITNIDLGNLIWGTYKNEPGSPYGTIIFNLKRTVDGQAVQRPLQITVNGQTWTLQPSTVHSIALPQNATTWNVKVTWAGDGVYQPFEVSKTFHKP